MSRRMIIDYDDFGEAAPHGDGLPELLHQPGCRAPLAMIDNDDGEFGGRELRTASGPSERRRQPRDRIRGCSGGDQLHEGSFPPGFHSGSPSKPAQYKQRAAIRAMPTQGKTSDLPVDIKRRQVSFLRKLLDKHGLRKMRLAVRIPTIGQLI